MVILTMVKVYTAIHLFFFYLLHIACFTYNFIGLHVVSISVGYNCSFLLNMGHMLD